MPGAEDNTQPQIKTYILVGDGIHVDLDNRGDAIIIRAENGVSIEDAVKSIAPPANIILDAHGGMDGIFEWQSENPINHQYEPIPYSRLFAALPREGIGTIALESCYGGSSEEDNILQTAPVGSLVQTGVSALNLESGSFAQDNIDKTNNGHL